MIIKKNKDEIQSYLLDAANYKGECSAVYFPENAIDLQKIILEANTNKARVTIAGNRTGVTGAAVPKSGSVISTEKLNRIIAWDDNSVTVEPGVILKDLQETVESKGLFYPPDPTERNCFVGGTIATNASGAKTLKYGSTRKFIDGLKIILPEGNFLTLKRGKVFANNYNLNFKTDSGKEVKLNLPEIVMPPTKHTAGYFIKPNMDLIDLFIGGEGTLGVIVEATLRLLPLPQNVISSVVFFNSIEDSLKFIDEANEDTELSASGLEFFDNYSLDFLRDDFPNIPSSAMSAVWFEQDDSSDTEKSFDLWLELVEKQNGDIDNSWVATTEVERNKFKDFRHSVSLKVNDFISQKGLRKVGTDTAVPRENFKEFYEFISNIAQTSGINYLIYGHFGNYHPHLNLLPKNDIEFAEAKKIYGKICKKAVELHGTISAEHGIGKMKHQYLLDMYGEEGVIKMAGIKNIFDPNKILGIGNIFDEKYLK